MNNHGRSGGRRGLWAPAATAALVLLLVMLIGGFALVAALEQSSSSAASKPSTTAHPSTSSSPSAGIGLGTFSPADRLAIPALGLHTRLVRLGDGAGGTMQLPPARGAGWYDKSVAPGQQGVAVVAGYIRRRSDVPGVFADLRRLHVGDRIAVHRQDGGTAVFAVSKVTAYAHGTFPAAAFYAGDGSPLLRIVTTGGGLTPKSPADGNVVVDAHIIDVR